MKSRRDLHLERMFETRSEAWEKVGLAVNVSQRAVKRARRQASVLLPILIGIVVIYYDRKTILHVGDKSPWLDPLRIGTVIALLALGWALARDIGKAAAPTFFRRMDPSTAGTVGFLIRLLTIVITIVISFSVAGANPGTLFATSAFTAVVFGLAAQQTLGNLIAGMVLLSARPFRVGERVRLQAGAVGGTAEGIVSSLGLLYTTLASGADNIMIPNNVVLAAAVVPLREPDAVDVRVTLKSGIKPSHVQALLDDRITTPTRSAAKVLLEAVDGDDVVVRVVATPERALDGAKLADELIETLSSVTGEHQAARDYQDRRGAGEHEAAPEYQDGRSAGEHEAAPEYQVGRGADRNPPTPGYRSAHSARP